MNLHLRFVPGRPVRFRPIVLTLLAGGCSLFGPRDPQPPNRSGLNLPPQTSADVVLSNLQASISGKSSYDYMRCFTNPVGNPRGLTFIPSPDYLAELEPWDWNKESGFFTDLLAKAQPNGVANLDLTEVSRIPSSDSVDYQGIYTLNFETTPDNHFGSRAHGRVEFKIGLSDNQTRWTIYYWADNPERSGDTTWSAFKRRFSTQ